MADAGEMEAVCCWGIPTLSARQRGTRASSRRGGACREGVLGICSPCAIAPHALNTEQEAGKWKQEGV